jgi:hypothetical protein
MYGFIDILPEVRVQPIDIRQNLTPLTGTVYWIQQLKEPTHNELLWGEWCPESCWRKVRWNILEQSVTVIHLRHIYQPTV